MHDFAANDIVYWRIMKNTDPVPRSSDIVTEDIPVQEQTAPEQKKRDPKPDKKKKKVNLWPLKAFFITFLLALAVNTGSELVLTDSQWWLATILTVVILLLGVLFDVIGTAATACDIGPFHSMASRKVKGGKMAVKLAMKRDIVSSVCCDIVGDICGIVSGVCGASLAAEAIDGLGLSTVWNVVIKVLIYSVISTLTITFKAVGKNIAVKKANGIIRGVAKALSIFSKEG